MSRVKLSEYKAKKILIGDSYTGIQIRSGKKEKVPQGRPHFASPSRKATDERGKASKGRWVAKVDQGIKKRFKLGLVAVDKPAAELQKAISGWEKKGFSQFLLEPFLPHEASEEQYLSLERVREGIRILHAAGGGIDIEEHPEKVSTYVLTSSDDLSDIERGIALPAGFLGKLFEKFEENFFSFVEINPLVVQGEEAHLLDAAVLADSAGAFFTGDAWTADVVETGAKHPAEVRVEALAATTPASLKLSVINPDGALFFLLSGGGGSIVIADEAQLEGAGHLIGNYGEYSGGPTREETYLYAKEVIGLALSSKAKKKALVIAGGVANFTDVRKTFAGITDALTERADDIRKQGMKVFVRRGGPHEKAGLELMEKFLSDENMLGSIYGSDTVITRAVEDAIRYIRPQSEL